jgi:phosphoglycolate phosphatase
MVRIYRPIPAAQLRLLVFDLDGTLIDSRKDLVESVNAALGRLQLPRQLEDAIASWIGDGASKLMERALAACGADPALVPKALEAFLDYYRDHKLDHTRLYPGVIDSLAALKQALSIPMAVLTNKPVRPSEQICEALELAPYFFSIYGGNSFVTKKPDPEGLLRLMHEASAEPGQTLMVGDSSVDVRTAQAAGAWSLGCRFGLSPHTIAELETLGQVDAVVDSANEWPAALSLSGAV